MCKIYIQYCKSFTGSITFLCVFYLYRICWLIGCRNILLTRFSYISKAFFQLNFSVVWLFLWIELQMLLRSCWIHITIIILGHFLFLVYLRPCIDLGLFLSYLCDLFFIFSLIYFAINHITPFKQTHLFFVHFWECLLLFLNDNVDEESE